MAKRSSEPRVAYPEVKVQVWDLVLVLGIVVPFGPRGSVLGEILFYRAQGGKWAQEACAECPKQRYATEEPSKAQGRDCMGIVEGSCGYRALRVSIRGSFVLSRNRGG